MSADSRRSNLTVQKCVASLPDTQGPKQYLNSPVAARRNTAVSGDHSKGLRFPRWLVVPKQRWPLA